MPLRDVVVHLLKAAATRADAGADSSKPKSAAAARSTSIAQCKILQCREDVVVEGEGGRRGMTCLLTFIDRAKLGSTSGSFSARADVVAAFEGAGCVLSEYHSAQVMVDSEPHRAVVLEIRLSGKPS